MPNTEHTPGPWTIRERKGKTCFSSGAIESLICAGTGNGFCLVELGGNAATSCQPKDVRANAYLIAAAPELLQELRNIADAKPSTWEPDMRDQFQAWAQSRARAAIAKATVPSHA
jgi:hypothetical protein